VLLCHLPPTESSANDLLWPNAPQYDGQTDDAVRRLHGRMRARDSYAPSVKEGWFDARPASPVARI
jgi:hypothetical protein